MAIVAPNSAGIEASWRCSVSSNVATMPCSRKRIMLKEANGCSGRVAASRLLKRRCLTSGVELFHSRQSSTKCCSAARFATTPRQ